MLVGEEIVAQALYRHAPLLTHEAQIILLEGGLYLFKASLHLATVREEREHRPALRTMRLDEQLLQFAEVARLIRLGNVVDHVDRHVVVEVVARIKHERRGMRLIGAAETD